ncbi:MAG: TetR/AcrR family transcriptional regulator [Lysinibacillus sp.]
MPRRAKIDMEIILQKATEMIDDKGPDHLSFSLLATELGIRPPSLYNHVSSLDDLKQLLAIRGLKGLYESMLHAGIGKSGDEAIHAISMGYVQFVRTHPGLYMAATRIPHSLNEEFEHHQQAILLLVLRILETYELSEEMAIHIVRGLRSILHGFTSLEQIGGFGMPLDIDQSLTILMNTFIEGIHSMSRQEENNE